MCWPVLGGCRLALSPVELHNLLTWVHGETNRKDAYVKVVIIHLIGASCRNEGMSYILAPPIFQLAPLQMYKGIRSGDIIQLFKENALW